MSTLLTKSLGNLLWRRAPESGLEAGNRSSARRPRRFAPHEGDSDESEVQPSYISKVPNDILVDEIFAYLEVLDILSLRQVCTSFYDLTHHAILWKNLLRRADIPIPPVPPTARHSLPHLSGLEAERLLLRAHSLHKSWLGPQNHRHTWRFNAHHLVHSMEFLPGGQYLVASVADNAEVNHSIVVYAMEHRYGGAIALAKVSTITKAYHLSVRYLTVGGQRSIVIAYVRRDYKTSEDEEKARQAGSSDLAYYSSTRNRPIDPEVRVKYECVALTISLEQLEILADERIVPGSQPYVRHAQTLPAPFCHLVHIRSHRQLLRPSLDEIYGSPYLAVVRSPDCIMFKKLDGGAVATLQCMPHPDHRVYNILAIRLISFQNSVLVLRGAYRGEYPSSDGRFVNLCEQYWVPPSKETHIEEQHAPFETVQYKAELNIVEAQITDHGLRAQDDDSFIPALYSAADNKIPRPISIAVFAANKSLLLHGTLFPRRIEHRVPLKLDSTMSSQTLGRSMLTHATYEYSVADIEQAISYYNVSPRARLCCLPGTLRSIVFLAPLDDNSVHPAVKRIGRYSEPASHGEAQRRVEKVDPAERSIQWIDLPREINPYFVGAMAWDEGIGRLCIACDGSPIPWVFDFAKAPRIDAQGQRMPLPVMLNSNPDRSHRPNPILKAQEEDERIVQQDAMMLDA